MQPWWPVQVNAALLKGEDLKPPIWLADQLDQAAHSEYFLVYLTDVSQSACLSSVN